MIITRLESLLGWNKLKNDVILFKNKSTSGQKLAIYFGGDIQDYHEQMKSHEENKRYQEWNLEATGRLLTQKFTHHMVMIVKASRMANQCYACYDHFVSKLTSFTLLLSNPSHVIFCFYRNKSNWCTLICV